MIDKTFIIGITGNIATGKSVVRRMLVNAGAFGIDADVLANRMLYPGAPAYQAVIHAFGPHILNQNQSISNKKLGEIVFNDPDRLQQLEALVHPMVIDAILTRISASKHPIVAVEAIKLLEAGLGKYCDQIWVSHVSEDEQVQRLLESRGMAEDTAMSRIQAQPAQSIKLSQADVIISTQGTYKDTWQRTQKALNDTIQQLDIDAQLNIKRSQAGLFLPEKHNSVSQLETSWRMLTQTDLTTLYEYLGLKMVYPLLNAKGVLAFVIWNEWNFTATLEMVSPQGILKEQEELIFSAFETHTQKNQTECLLLSEALIHQNKLDPGAFGFSHQHFDQLPYLGWKLAAQKALKDGESHIWAKVLAQPFENKREIIDKVDD